MACTTSAIQPDIPFPEKPPEGVPEMPENVPDLTPPAPLGNTYTSRPVSITAMQWTGENLDDIKAWVGDDNLDHWASGVALTLWVEANTSWLPLEPGEWIVKDELGFYPCKDSIFQRKYEAARG